MVSSHSHLDFVFSFILCAIVSISLVTCEDNCIGEHAYEDRCMPNNEIHFYYCENVKVGSSYFNRWVRYEKSTKKCKKSDTCSCFTQTDDPYDGTVCECITPVDLPVFPSFGVLRFTENQWIYDGYSESEDNPSSVDLPGEIHVNGHGRFLKTWTNRGENTVSFRIIIPTSGGKLFYELTGNKKSRKCEIRTISEGGDWSLWQTFSGWPNYKLTKEEKISKSIVRQKWFTYDYYETRYEFTWIMDKNIDTGISLPVEYKFYYADYAMEVSKKYTTKYKYEALKENDESFKVEDFCDNEIW